MKADVTINGNFTEVRVDATLNKGNYENEKVGVTFSLAEGDNVFEVINLCKDVVYGRTVVGKPEVKKEEPKTKLKTEAAKEEAKAVVETAVEEAKAEEVVEKKEEPKKEKAAKKVAAPKSRATPYNRADEGHKRLLSAFLDKAQPNWKTKEVIAKASKASQILSEAGEDFLDGEGVLLQSFKDKFLEQLRA